MTLDPQGPIVVGALGGSGTRVLGQVLLALGVHLGDHRNQAEDSLTASLLFNRPGDDGDRAEQVRRFEQIGRLLRGEADRRDRIAVLAAVRGVDHPPLRYRLRYALGSVRERGAPADATGWGFKEPNTHLFLDALAETFARLRFVYVMRHPLDMAFSANRQQLENWARRFEVTVPTDPARLPEAQLDLWLAATGRARRLGPELLGDRFLALDYEALVRDPATGVAGLCRFVAIEPDDLESLVALVRTPDSAGRFRREDLSVFRRDQLDAVAAAGFPLS